jgi:NAD(P)-dependent dehydrogenase (short-subunit alcohol dehydrogenase family)
MDRVVVVTGASAGVGRAAAIAFAENGDDVALLARGDAGLEGAASDVRRRGQRALPISVDVADADAVEAAADRIERELGPIDVWINNAMESVFSPVSEMRSDEYRRVTEVTYLGYVYGTQSALRRLLPRDRGVIVQVGSALAYRSIPLQSAYCGAKHAIVGFTDSLRSELIHDGSNVKVTEVNLPALNTPQFGWVRTRLPRKGQPVPPIFEPEVAAKAIVYASEHPRRQLLVGRSTYLAVWGQKFIPGLLDIYLAKKGYAGQQTDEPEQPGRPDNLDRPLDATVDHGPYGEFGTRSGRWSPALELTMRRGQIAAGVGAAAVAAVLGARVALPSRKRS